MMLKTDYRDSGAGNLVDYIRRDRVQDAGPTVDLRNPAGRELSDPEVHRFVGKSREFGFQRHMIVSPDPTGQYSSQEVRDNTREFMNRGLAQQPTTDYVYAVHRDTEFPHAHIAATGERAELEMDREDIRRLREQVATAHKEPARTRNPTPATPDASDNPGRIVDRDAREQYHEAELSLDPEAEKALKRTTEKSLTKEAGQTAAETEHDKSRTEPRSEQHEDRGNPECEQDRERETRRMMGDGGEF